MSSWNVQRDTSAVGFDAPSEEMRAQVVVDEKEGSGEVQVVTTGIGLLPDEVYDKQLPPLIAAFRRRVRRGLKWETDVLSRMQVRASWSFAPRLPWLISFLYSEEYAHHSWMRISSTRRRLGHTHSS